MKPYNKYIKDVISGKILACKDVINACKRHLGDLETLPKDRFKFSEELADYYINFIQGLSLSSGDRAGHFIELQPWQQFTVAMIFGWYELRDGHWCRRFKKYYVSIPRKNGKTTKAAAITLCLMVPDQEADPRIYHAATGSKQARLCFDETKNMIAANEHLDEILEVYENNIHFKDKRPGRIEPISGTPNKSGFNVHGAIIDEVWEHKKRTLIDLLTTATSVRSNPLIYFITTAPDSMTSVCYELHKMTQDINAGIIKNENWGGIVYGIDEDDDWTDPRSWLKANPNLGVPGAKKMSYLEAEFLETKGSPGKEQSFKRLDLNMLIFGVAGWISDEVWMGAKTEIDWEYVEQLPCWGGLDLAQSKDFSSLVLLYYDADKKKMYLKEYVWAAAANLEHMARNLTPNIIQWVEDGFITETGGNIMDADFVEENIISIIKSVPNFKSLAYDRMYAHTMALHFEAAGIECQEFNQGVKNFAAPTAGFEAELKAGNIYHKGNPVTRWMVSNAVIKRVNDMQKVVRDSSKYKIDSVIAALQAYGQMLTDTAVPDEPESPYDSRGIVVFGG